MTEPDPSEPKDEDEDKKMSRSKDTGDRHLARFLRNLPKGQPPSEDGSASSGGSPPDTGVGRFGDDPLGNLMARLPSGMRETFLSAHPEGSLGRYLVIEELGHGGMGVVLRAYDPKLQREVALKMLPAGVLDTTSETRVVREARALAKLAHPNVVQVFEVGESEGKLFVAMELVEGQTLRQWQNEGDSPRGWKECLEVYLQAGRGLAAAHAKGLVHRDFKPDNAVIDEEGRARVLDFGLARRDAGVDATDERLSMIQRAQTDKQQAVPLDMSLTETGTVLGTPAYMPLEQMNGLEADARSDQFSFCVALYEALYGERPHEDNTLATLMIAVQDGLVRPAPKGSKVPAALRTVLLRGLATQRDDRWPSMEELLAELQRLVAPRARRWVAGVGLALAAAAGVVALQQSGVVSEQEEQLTEKEAQLKQELEENQQLTEEVTAKLAAQRGLRAKDIAKDTGRELEAVRVAIEAFEGLDTQAGTIPVEVFEGLTHALAGIDRGIALRGHTGRVVDVTVSPDGGTIATASKDGTVRLWDADSGALHRTIEGQHKGAVHAVAWSPDGTRMATASEDKTARIWDVATGKLVDRLHPLPHPGPVDDVAFSPDGGAIATASGDVAWVWHMNVEAIVMSMLGHTGRVRSVAWSPDGTRLWTASEDHTVRAWDAHTGATVQTLEGHEGPVYDVTISPDGTRIATAGQDETARLWDPDSGEELASFEHGEVVYAVALSPDGTRLATGTFDDGAAHLWDVATANRLGSFQHTDAVVDVAFSPGGHQLVTASWDQTARSWDLDPGGALTTLPSHGSRADAVAFSPDGSRVAAGLGNGTTRVWDARTGAALATLRGHRLDVLAVTFSPDGSRLATASWDETARVWDATSGALVQTLEGHTDPVRSVAFSPDGGHIVTASRDGTARMWNAATGEELRSLSHGGSPDGPVIDAIFAPGGQRHLTLGADDRARVWSAATGEELSAPSSVPPDEPVTAVAFSPDGTRIAVATKDSVVHVRKADSGETVASFSGHSALVRTVMFSPDGLLVATASEDGTARVWDIATEQPRATLPHKGPLKSVAFSPDGTYLATASDEEGARLWALDPRPWQEWGCAVLDQRQAHSDGTRGACSRTVAEATDTTELSFTITEPVVAPTEATGPMPDVITVHGVELVLIPGGTFTMGSPPDEHGRFGNEGPQHEVTLDSFYLARTEVTYAQYALYLEANPEVSKPPVWGDERYNQPEQPVIGVNWHDAKAYCDWAGLVLPTEAQWEYAARAGTTTAYWFGDKAEDLERFDWYENNAVGSFEKGRPHSVGTKGANPFGLYDMHGNVREWALDAYESSYTTSVRAGDGLRKQPVGDASRVIRGGRWSYFARSARSAYRVFWNPGYRSFDVGFRPAQGIH